MTVLIEIETAIRNVSWATMQVGQKSLQKIAVDFNKKTVMQSYHTGTTGFLWMDLSSARDSFKIVRPRFSRNSVPQPLGMSAYFTASGETASGVHVMPNISYSFDFIVSEDTVTIDGSHDGYPSYNVSVNGTSAYDAVQGYIWELAGDSDVTVRRKVFTIDPIKSNWSINPNTMQPW